jgi:hypothetical protein
MSGFCIPTFAMGNNDPQLGLTQEEAGNIALWYMANDIKDNTDSKWSKNTRIREIVDLYDENENITSYCFELNDGNTENGYVMVSATSDSSLIQEFSYTGKPAYYNSDIDNFDRVYYTAPMEYAVSKNDKLFTTDKKEVNRKDIKSKLKHSKEKLEKNQNKVNRVKKDDHLKINEWMCGYNGQITGQSGYGGIYDPYTYCNDRYGSGWTLKSSKYLSVTPRLQNDLEANASNCTLSSITMAFDYHRAQGQSGIPSSISTLYADVRSIAVGYGYTPSGGTNPTYADDIVTDLWKKYGHTNGRGNNDYILSWSTAQAEIDQNRPFVFNIGFGYYSNHSICVTGYCIYKGSHWYNSDTEFFKVNDNWTTNARYIDWDAWGSSSLGSFTKIFPS